jgi:hypothetical protein
MKNLHTSFWLKVIRMKGNSLRNWCSWKALFPQGEAVPKSGLQPWAKPWRSVANVPRVSNILFLRTLVPACKKDGYCLSTLGEVDPIAWSAVNSQL